MRASTSLLEFQLTAKLDGLVEIIDALPHQDADARGVFVLTPQTPPVIVMRRLASTRKDPRLYGTMLAPALQERITAYFRSIDKDQFYLMAKNFVKGSNKLTELEIVELASLQDCKVLKVGAYCKEYYFVIENHQANPLRSVKK